MNYMGRMAFAMLASVSMIGVAAAQTHDVDALKTEVQSLVDGHFKLAQVINDKIFSYAEVGFREWETQKFLTSILADAGFEIETGTRGIPTAWVAKWSNGTGKPFISLATDVDGLPGLSQKPGVLTQEPLVEGGNGHGEGHNGGMALTIAGVLALQELMKKENIDGTLQIWPGIAEEALAGKMWMIDAGVLEEADAVIFSHVGNALSTQWGLNSSTGMVSVEYSFQGVTSHAAGAPWVGRSALDAVELMNTAWNFRREHIHPNQRSHYVITNGGLQPNIVPEHASVWYYFRHNTAPQVQEMLEIADGIAEGASLMTGATWKRKILGSTWPYHPNKALAEAMQANIDAVGMPDWSEDDQAYAKAVQESVGAAVVGLRTAVSPLAGPIAAPSSGGSDDIGQVTWVKPTVRLSFPSNIAGTTGHNWQAALSMATPIAHKGNIQGAKVLAMTTLDMLLKPDLLEAANEYFAEQTKTIKYYPLEGPDDVPSIHLNAENDAANRPKQEEFYYDETKYDTYLEQLGVAYPVTQK